MWWCYLPSLYSRSAVSRPLPWDRSTAFNSPSPCGIYLEPINHLQVRTSMARHLAAQGSSCTCSPCWSCANVQQTSTAWGMVVYPVPALTRAMNSASRGAVWVAASFSTIFTIANLKTQAQRPLRAWGAIAKPFLLGGCLRFAAADWEMCLCILYPLEVFNSCIYPSSFPWISYQVIGAVMIVGSHRFASSCEQASISLSMACVVSSTAGEAHCGTHLSWLV